jgi:hypothetical protein
MAKIKVENRSPENSVTPKTLPPETGTVAFFLNIFENLISSGGCPPSPQSSQPTIDPRREI